MVDHDPLFKVAVAVDLFSMLGRFPNDILRKNKAGLVKSGMLIYHLKR